MAICFAVLGGTSVYANEIPLIKLMDNAKKLPSMVVSSHGFVNDIHVMFANGNRYDLKGDAKAHIKLGDSIVIPDLKMDILVTKLNYGNDRGTSLRLSCKSLLNKIKFEVKRV